MRYIDTHAHYNDEVYNGVLDEYLTDSINKFVEKIINVSFNLESSISSIELSHKYDYIYCAIGFHPSEAKFYDEDLLVSLLNDDKIVGIGEIGLDYHYGSDDSALQKEVFIKQINIARKYNLPVIIHSRDASFDTYNIVNEYCKRFKGFISLFCSY